MDACRRLLPPASVQIAPSRLAIVVVAAALAGGCCCSRPGLRVQGSLEVGPPTGGDCDSGCSGGHNRHSSFGGFDLLPPPVDSGAPSVSPDARFHPVPTHSVFAPKPIAEPARPRAAREPESIEPAELEAPPPPPQAAKARAKPLAQRSRAVRSVWVEPPSTPRRNNGRPARPANTSRRPPLENDDA